ncbi:putative flippase GtrA [Sphingobacterium allocomposti]|jgi:putative flippase GtrA|uniref:Putative flippase GtrA n=1 Tax=Sphingobacterium allocomposti TaxID=415956 RepID=A0A5S5DKZ9_9SPHI|nr:GtrA family protein [Sphingobacterium composti Yoo et al. 2007 non Ten et al. 2007]TYP96294.1 putative flippase GtrA [Sphingobacterium composti Yoo et al. 2007 non Ten et al. 2007]HLS94007.1 GtrA family protein [Sphingobacterium sp.]
MKQNDRGLRQDFFLSFGKAQISAFIGGLSDFAIYTFCLQVFGFSAHGSNIVSGSLGAIVNFLINRYWAFDSRTTPIGNQLFRFIVVVVGSITLKSTGIYFLVDYLFLNPFYSKIVVELLVSLCFNFVLQKYWVFRKRSA